MAIDTSIYNSLLRPPKSIAEYDAEAMSNQQNKLALQSQQMQMADRQRGIADEQQLRGVVSQFGADKGANYNALLGSGRLKEAQAYEKSNVDIEKERNAARKEQLEGAFKELEYVGQLMSGITDQATYTAARARFAAELGPERAAQIPEAYDPKTVNDFRLQAQDMKTQLAQEWESKKYHLDVRKVDETVRNNKEQTSVQVRGQNMTSATAAAGRAVTVRGQNMTDARSKETNSMGSKAPPGYRFNADGSMSAIAGGPADLKNGAEAVKKVSEAKDVLSLLDEADSLLPKGTSGYIGTGVDKLLGAGGVSTAGAQATAQLKAIEGALISKMPKMSGPQSDKDVLLYKQMAGQVGDSTIPTAQRQAASGTIRKLNEKYAGMAEGSSKKSAGAFSDAEKERRYQEFKAKQGK